MNIIKKSSCTVIFLFFLFFFCTCQKVKTPSQSLGIILFYIMADNDLSNYANGDLVEIEQAIKNISETTCRTLVYIDQLNSPPKLMEIVKTKTGIKQILLADYIEQNSCDPAVLLHVLSQVFQPKQTGRRGLIFWSHGTGWFPSSILFTRSIGIDTETGDSSVPNMIDIIQLSDVLSYFPPFDFIAFDACFMGSVEVAYELKNHCQVMIASPAEIMADGFDYIKGYKYLATTNYSPTKFIQTTYQYYLSSQTPYAALSVIKTEALEELAMSYSRLVSEYGRKAQAGIPHFDRNSTNYFYDFGFMINSYPESKYRSSVLKAFNNVIQSEYHTSELIDADISGTSGLSIYLPSVLTEKVNTEYKKFEWYKCCSLLLGDEYFKTIY